MSTPAPQPGNALARRPLPELGLAGPVEVAAPPAPPDNERGWPALLLPIASAFGMVGFALLAHNVLALALGGGFAAVSAFGAVAASRHQRRRRERAWARRAEDYRAQLAECGETLADAASRQRSYGMAVHPPPASACPASAGGAVWERRAGSDDRFVVRLGIGRARARRSPSRSGGAPVSGADPELSRLADDLCGRRGGVDGVALGLDLAQTRAAVLLGDQLPLQRALVLSLTRAVGPEAMLLHALAPPAELAWLRLLPHAGCLARDPGSLVADLRSLRRVTEGASLHHVIVLAGTEDEVRSAWEGLTPLLDQTPSLDRTSTAAVSVIASLPRAGAVPTEADLIISPDSEGGVLVQACGERPLCTAVALPDRISHAQAVRYAETMRSLAPRVPASVVATSPGLDSLLSQGKRHPLQLPIGIDDEGAVVQLDLREAARGGDGPHGLLVGATGSGKSELLRTLLMAAAAQNRPWQLTFLLVDFKGGAALSELGRLPHSAGLLTNLTVDQHGVDRLCAALRAELRRRQRVLRAAGVDDIDALPAATSSAAAAADAASAHATLPRLLVVIDEYAELVEQSPDALEVLTSLARLGRSLGIHLLLCSQRLDDGRLRGLEAHLRYRICLRTFTVSESISALGTDIASRLPAAPGWGYLARDSQLTRLRVALVGDQAAAVTAVSRSAVTHLDKHPAHPVCPPPLPESLTLDQLPASAASAITRAAIGLCDRPDLGQQLPLTFDLATDGHVAVVGAPGSGRSTLLTTLVVALAGAVPGRDLAVHVVTPAGGPLAAAGGLPHVGTVATSAQLAARVIRTIAETVAERRSASSTDRRRILLVIDDLAAVLAADDDLATALAVIATTGQPASVTLAVSCGRWAELRGGLREAMATRFELACAEPADSMLPQLARTFPQRPAGRVMTGDGRWAQIALTPGELVASVVRRGGPPTAPIQLLPLLVPAESLAPASSSGRVVLGVSGAYARPMEVGLGAGEHLLVLGNSGTGRSGLLRAVTGSLQERGVRTWLIDPRRSMIGVDRRAFRTAASADEAAALVQELVSAGRSGTRDVLVIDDQELAAGRNGAAVLAPLLDLLPFSADVGLSVVCARRLSGFSRGAFEPFFAGFLEMCDTAVVLSGDPSQGPVVGGIRPRRLPPGRGQLVVRGEPVGEVQLAWRAGDGTDDCAGRWSVIQAAQSGFTPSARFPVT